MVTEKAKKNIWGKLFTVLKKAALIYGKSYVEAQIKKSQQKRR